MSVIKLDSERYFLTTEGVVITKEEGRRIMKDEALRQKNLLLHSKVQVVHNVDKKKLGLGLTGRNGYTPARNGFLITVFLRQSDGTRTQLYNSNTLDPVSGVTLRSSLQEYVDIEVDK